MSLSYKVSVLNFSGDEIVVKNIIPIPDLKVIYSYTQKDTIILIKYEGITLEFYVLKRH